MAITESDTTLKNEYGKPDSAPPDYDPEEEWRAALSDLQAQLQKLKWAKRGLNKDAIRNAEECVVAAVLKVGSIIPYPEGKEEWDGLARRFSEGDEQEKENVLGELGKHIAKPEVPEEEWKRALGDLQLKLDLWKKAKREGEDEHRALLEAEVVAAMRKLALIHTDPVVKKQWNDRADKFVQADENEKEGIIEGLGKGLLILLATPFALAGGVIFAAGAIVYGAGKIIVGLGNALTLGKLRR